MDGSTLGNVFFTCWREKYQHHGTSATANKNVDAVICLKGKKMSRVSTIEFSQICQHTTNSLFFPISFALLPQQRYKHVSQFSTPFLSTIIQPIRRFGSINKIFLFFSFFASCHRLSKFLHAKREEEKKVTPKELY